ncbi:hypothetical protein MRB53_037183 [Persea americana]|nr:hypothetical protein MRB53_037183 [Persea americana]
MTLWYEMPDDHKDTWHWMGVAVSIAHTIGLNHRLPSAPDANPKKQRLWRRMWWSCVIRDQFISTGMRRPMRIKTQDYDVPMLTLEDFDLEPLPDNLTCIAKDCVMARDTTMQRTLAVMYIELAKLCLCMSHVFNAQYALTLDSTIRADDDAATATVTPKRLDGENSEVKDCHDELEQWLSSLPPELDQDTMINQGDERDTAAIAVHGAMLHLMYQTTVSMLHRPQIMPKSAAPATEKEAEIIALSRTQVKNAAISITEIVRRLTELKLVRFLPTAAVTVLMPALVQHIMVIKYSRSDLQCLAIAAFCVCVRVMSRLRELYASADFSMALLDIGIKKFHISVPTAIGAAVDGMKEADMVPINSSDELVKAGMHLGLASPSQTPLPSLTPRQEDRGATLGANPIVISEQEVKRRIDRFITETPPESSSEDEEADGSSDENEQAQVEEAYAGAAWQDSFGAPMDMLGIPDMDLDAFMNADHFGGFMYNDGGGGLANMQGESSGFALDMNWLERSVSAPQGMEQEQSGAGMNQNWVGMGHQQKFG